MKEAKIDFDLLKVGNSLSNRGLAEIFFSPLALKGNEIIEGSVECPPPFPQMIKVGQLAWVKGKAEVHFISQNYFFNVNFISKISK